MIVGPVVSRLPDLETVFSTDSNPRIWPGSVVLAGTGALARIADLPRGGRLEVIVDVEVASRPVVAEVLGAVADRADIHLNSGKPIVQAVASYCKRNPTLPETMVVIGGGSTIDFAKGTVAFRALGGWPEAERGRYFAGLDAETLDLLPFMIAAPSTAGSGAEQSRYFVLYDETTGIKRLGRTWGSVADVALIDPVLLSSVPLRVLAGTSFDAFMHLLEALIARGESNQWARGIALSNIPSILECVAAIVDGVATLDTWMRLGVAASLAGNVISNVRTGLVHEAAGPLTEIFGVPHGEALFACSRASFGTIEGAVPEPLDDLLSQRRVRPYGSDLDSLLDWWEAIFVRCGVAKVQLARTETYDGSSAALLQQVMTERLGSDDVLRFKTHPVRLSDQMLKGVVSDVIREVASE